VNPGGEPERDETGLPPVDIEIPDDARELDRDVQAYHRELRAHRRQQRSLRVRGTLAKDGIVLPLLACCLILALITGTLLTVFTATSDQAGLLGSGQPSHPPTASRSPSGAATPGGSTSTAAGSSGAASSANAAPAHPPPDTVPGSLPPGATITVGAQAPLVVHDLSGVALILVPSHCNCAAAVKWLVGIVIGAHGHPYLVYTGSTKADVEQLHSSLSSSSQRQVVLASAPDDALRESIPAALPEDNLTAILLGPKAVVYATRLGPNDNPSTLIEALTH
jgi:hypothetical protein